MLNWVEILRRILHLYTVKTQAELGMVLGMPIHVGLERPGEGAIIPWPVLEKVVLDKKVSWDWLLTGREAATASEADAGGGDETRRFATPPAAPPEGDASQKPLPGQTSRRLYPASSPPADPLDNVQGRSASASGRYETRELERTLLTKESSRRLTPRNPDPGQATTAGEPLRRELEDIRATMLREIERVDKLLEEKGTEEG